MINIAVFASGSGSNAESIAKYFRGNEKIKIALFVTNNSKAGVIERGKNAGIPILIIKNDQLNKSSFLEELKNKQIDFIVLAGFLRLIPKALIDNYPNKILNIHPALLPKYGGKGMYGMNVHRAVVDAGEKETGLTIHLVNNEYDKGKILFKKKVKILPQDKAEDIAEKVLRWEHECYPKVIEDYVLKNS